MDTKLYITWKESQQRNSQHSCREWSPGPSSQIPTIRFSQLYNSEDQSWPSDHIRTHHSLLIFAAMNALQWFGKQQLFSPPQTEVVELSLISQVLTPTPWRKSYTMYVRVLRGIFIKFKLLFVTIFYLLRIFFKYLLTIII